MLRFAEELILLLMNDERGGLVALPGRTMDYALAGAVLMDLSLENRIDSDLEKLFLIDSTPLGDDLLDPTLAEIAAAEQTHGTQYWVQRIAERGEALLEQALARLCERGILEPAAGNLFFLSRSVAHARRYPTKELEAKQEVRLRIMQVLFSRDIPDPQDSVLIGLAEVCGVFKMLLSKAELEKVQERIDLVKSLDLIGQAVAQAIQKSAAAEQQPAIPKPIPQVKGLPLLGNALEMAGDLRAFLTQQYKKMGPVFQVKAGGRRFVVLAGRQANQFFARHAKTHFRSYEFWIDFHGELGGARTLINMEGPDHIRMRRVLTAGYGRQAIETRIAEVIDITRRDLDTWPVDRPIPGFHTLQRIVTEQLGLLTTGVSPQPYLDDLIFVLDTLLMTRVMRQRPAFWYARRLRRALGRVRQLHRAVLAAHAPQRRLGRPADLIDDLLELHRTDPQFMPETELMASVIGPFLAGLDTVAATAAFMLYSALKQPGLLEQMTAEADQLLAAGTPTVAAVRRLDVTHRVAKETLRMYPIVPATVRMTMNSFEFAGYQVEAGTPVMMAMSVPHYLPEYFPDPDRFDIDRYTQQRQEDKTRAAYAPFGLGPHACLGSGFAGVQLAVTVATILRECALVLDPPQYDMKIKSTPSLRPQGRFKFRVVRRR